MRFSTLATLSAFTLATQAIYLPTIDASVVAVASGDLIPRQCSGCDGSGTWSGTSGSTSTSASASVDLSVFASVDDLNCLNSAVQTFITYATSLSADLKADVLVKAAAISSWSQADIVTLDAALAALVVAKDTAILGAVHFTDATFVGICAKASITVAISEEEIACLRAFIATTLTASFDISVSTEAYILNWCNSIVGYSYSQYVSLSAEISAAIRAFGTTAVSTGSSTTATTSTTVAASVSGVIALRAHLLAYVQGLINTSTSIVIKVQLVAVVALINAWAVGSVVTEADFHACTAILVQLSSCGYDAKTVLGLDLTVFGQFYVSGN